jgi:hypothetical protein
MKKNDKIKAIRYWVVVILVTIVFNWAWIILSPESLFSKVGLYANIGWILLNACIWAITNDDEDNSQKPGRDSSVSNIKLPFVI